MRDTNNEDVAVFNLMFRDGFFGKDVPEKSGRFPLPGSMLMENARWFCRLRWGVLSMLLLFGLLTYFPYVTGRFGLMPRQNWAIYLALGLSVTNFMFMYHLKALSAPVSYGSIRLNLWSQIVSDLIILMIAVHYSGSLRTYLPFTFLFHIVLSCIFFTRPESFLVTVLSSALLSVGVYLDYSGIYPWSSLFVEGAGDRICPVNCRGSLPAIIIIWFIVWYLASHLSKMLREREFELAETNMRLQSAQKDKTRHMLRTTHELKAPFAAIHANTQFLLKGYCGELSEKAVEVLNRIAARSRRLNNEIQEMLQLANLSAAVRKDLHWENVDISEALQWCIGMVEPLAEERHVTIESSVEAVSVLAVDDYIKMLFGNLLSNAVTYSMEGGVVTISCTVDDGGGALVIIRDKGIGIPPDKLPRIFDEYYRTDEAARFNKASSGLGLSIVRNVAESHGIDIRVESALGKGTAFYLKIPKNAQIHGSNHNREK